MKDVYSIVPAGPGAALMLVAISVLVLALGLMLMFIVVSMRHASVTLGPEHLRLRADLVSRCIDYRDLDIDAARVVNLEHETELRPRWKQRGTGLPGYQSGWFKLRDGSKALLAVTERTRVVHLPTRKGYSLLMSVENPDSFMRDLVRLAQEGNATGDSVGR